MPYDFIASERRDGVLCVTLQRPDRLNAAIPAMFDEIRHAVETRGDARAILLRGAGRSFCAGGDLQWIDEQKEEPKAITRRALGESYNPTIKAIFSCPVPVVCAVQGAAAGIGCSLALATDICVAAESSYFLQAFVKIGRVVDGGASWLLPRAIGLARAKAMALLGERLTARQALEWGLIYRVVADDLLVDVASDLAKQLAAGPTKAIGAMKNGFHASLDVSLDEAMAREVTDQCAIRDTADSAEGTAAFLEKRQAHFVGR